MPSEIFSFHLANVPLWRMPGLLLWPPSGKGLRHGECFFTMNLGEPIMTGPRYNFRTVAFFAWWEEEAALSEFLTAPRCKFLNDGWHVRMQLYRRWGGITEVNDAVIDESLAVPGKPVVAVTLARLRLLEAVRFTKWGRPVERQVRDHHGQNLALAGMRPLGTFTTFSIWQNEAEMLNMVRGTDKLRDGESHRSAMQERVRKDFHYQFATMRFMPLSEAGVWNGKSNYTSA